MDNKYDIFISYSRKDMNIVQPFTEVLRENGYTVWIDLNDISGGHEFPEEISNAISGCGMLLFFSSQDSNQSKWVKREVIYADNQNKTILPICLDSSEYNPSLLLLLTGVENINAQNGIDTVKKDILSAIKKDIGYRTERDVCPVIEKICPTGKDIKNNNTAKAIVDKTNYRLMMRHAIRNEAFIFAALCEAVWLLIIGCPLVYCGFLSHSYSIVIASSIAFFGSIYGTNISTLSAYVPGWYNRHLTSYGALILALEAYMTLFAFSVFEIPTSLDYCHAIYTLYALLGLVAMAMIFRLNKIGYYLLWLDGVLMAGTSYFFLPAMYNIIVPIILFCIYTVFMIILIATLQLHHNGTSTWALLFNKKVYLKDQNTTKLELFLMKIWCKIYR